MIPKIISQVLSNDKNIILGDTKPTRDFNFITDTCKAIECSIKKRQKLVKSIIMDLEKKFR